MYFVHNKDDCVLIMHFYGLQVRNLRNDEENMHSGKQAHHVRKMERYFFTAFKEVRNTVGVRFLETLSVKRQR